MQIVWYNNKVYNFKSLSSFYYYCNIQKPNLFPHSLSSVKSRFHNNSHVFSEREITYCVVNGLFSEATNLRRVGWNCTFINYHITSCVSMHCYVQPFIYWTTYLPFRHFTYTYKNRINNSFWMSHITVKLRICFSFLFIPFLHYAPIINL